jgi:serine/threonine protein phosphatase 1
METRSEIVKLPKNCLGKDYVIGDLHGCLDLLQQLLAAVQFDQTRDRLFSVGDLIDRGPNSLDSLQLLAEPWFYAVQGNHERMLLDFFQQYLLDWSLDSLDDNFLTGFLWNGGNWAEAHFLPDQRKMSAEFDRGLQLAAALPLLLVVGDDDQRFHVIHAELAKPPFKAVDPVWLDCDVDLWLAQGCIPADATECLLWARAWIPECEQRDPNPVHSGLSTTFCGHTFDSKPRQVLSHICLDTGAFLSCGQRTYWQSGDFGLTLFDVSDNRWFSASYQREHVLSGELQQPLQAAVCL